MIALKAYIPHTAIEYKVYSDGTKEWYVNNKYPLEDGPAVEYPNGTKEWHLNDKQVTEND